MTSIAIEGLFPLYKYLVAKATQAALLIALAVVVLFRFGMLLLCLLGPFRSLCAHGLNPMCLYWLLRLCVAGCQSQVWPSQLPRITHAIGAG